LSWQTAGGGGGTTSSNGRRVAQCYAAREAGQSERICTVLGAEASFHAYWREAVNEFGFKQRANVQFQRAPRASWAAIQAFKCSGFGALNCQPDPSSLAQRICSAILYKLHRGGGVRTGMPCRSITQAALALETRRMERLAHWPANSLSSMHFPGTSARHWHTSDCPAVDTSARAEKQQLRARQMFDH
jgi:hypothetical protein